MAVKLVDLVVTKDDGLGGRSTESPDLALQREGPHKVLGRGRRSAERTRALRACVHIRWRAAAELGS